MKLIARLAFALFITSVSLSPASGGIFGKDSGKKERRASKRRTSKRAKRAKPRRPKKAKQRTWFGQGWDLSGPKPQPDSTGQG